MAQSSTYKMILITASGPKGTQGKGEIEEQNYAQLKMRSEF